MASSAGSPSRTTWRGRPGGAAGSWRRNDGAPDEDGVDLVEASAEADGAVLHDAAPVLEQEHVVELRAGVGVAHVGAGGGPAVEGRVAVEAAVRGLVVVALDPRPQAAVEGLDAADGVEVEVVEPALAQGSEPSLDLRLRGRLEGPGVDQRDAELGADEGEMAGAVAGAVVDVEADGQSAAHEGLLSTGRKAAGVRAPQAARWRTRRRRDAGGVVDEGDQVGLASPPAVGDVGAVHDVAHPQFAGMAVGEAPPVVVMRHAGSFGSGVDGYRDPAGYFGIFRHIGLCRCREPGCSQLGRSGRYGWRNRAGPACATSR